MKLSLNNPLITFDSLGGGLMVEGIEELPNHIKFNGDGEISNINTIQDFNIVLKVINKHNIKIIEVA